MALSCLVCLGSLFGPIVALLGITFRDPRALTVGGRLLLRNVPSLIGPISAILQAYVIFKAFPRPSAGESAPSDADEPLPDPAAQP